jgi:MSHA pilin protein MshD
MRNIDNGLQKNICGVTLIELVLSITIVAIAALAVLGVLSYSARGSADAMVRNQEVAIASAYLEEILTKNFVVGPQSSRATFDDVSDYNGLSDVGAKDQFGNAISGLSNYTVTVSVGSGTLGSLSSATIVKRIDVTVLHVSTGMTVKLSGYKTNY